MQIQRSHACCLWIPLHGLLSSSRSNTRINVHATSFGISTEPERGEEARGKANRGFKICLLNLDPIKENSSQTSIWWIAICTSSLQRVQNATSIAPRISTQSTRSCYSNYQLLWLPVHSWIVSKLCTLMVLCQFYLMSVIHLIHCRSNVGQPFALRRLLRTIYLFI